MLNLNYKLYLKYIFALIFSIVILIAIPTNLVKSVKLPTYLFIFWFPFIKNIIYIIFIGFFVLINNITNLRAFSFKGYYKEILINILLSSILGLFGLYALGNLRNKLYRRTLKEIRIGLSFYIPFLIFAIFDYHKTLISGFNLTYFYNIELNDPVFEILGIMISSWWLFTIFDTYYCTQAIKNNTPLPTKEDYTDKAYHYFKGVSWEELENKRR